MHSATSVDVAIAEFYVMPLLNVGTPHDCLMLTRLDGAIGS